jgi:excisionase family DNA binding protein
VTQFSARGGAFRRHGKIQPPAPSPFLDKKPTDVGALLTIAEVADLFKVSTGSVRRWQQNRAIPFLKVGRGIRFDRRDLATFYEQCRNDRIG